MKIAGGDFVRLFGRVPAALSVGVSSRVALSETLRFPERRCRYEGGEVGTNQPVVGARLGPFNWLRTLRRHEGEISGKNIFA